MKIEFTRAEIERIILGYANTVCPGYGFNSVAGQYVYIPSTITVEKTDVE
jgi:hypothetical protein